MRWKKRKSQGSKSVGIKHARRVRFMAKGVGKDTEGRWYKKMEGGQRKVRRWDVWI